MRWTPDVIQLDRTKCLGADNVPKSDMLEIDAGASTTDATSGWKCTQQTKTAKNLRVDNIQNPTCFRWTPLHQQTMHQIVRGPMRLGEIFRHEERHADTAQWQV